MIESLPNELIINILEYLNMTPLYIITTASKKINYIAGRNRDALAKEILVRYGVIRQNITNAYDTLELFIFNVEHLEMQELYEVPNNTTPSKNDIINYIYSIL